MKEKIFKTIPDDVLKEMEEIQVLGGTSADGDDTNFLGQCNSNTYCDGANCVENCGGKKDPDDEQP